MAVPYPGNSSGSGQQSIRGSSSFAELLRQAAQGWALQQSNSKDESPSPPFDPNFRQLSSWISYPSPQGESPEVQSRLSPQYPSLQDPSLQEKPSSDATAISNSNSENAGEVNERPAPTLAGFGQLVRQLGPIGSAPPVSSKEVTKIPMPSVPEAWRSLGALFLLMQSMQRGALGSDDLNRCLRAAGGKGGDWNVFCDGLPVRLQNKVVGGQSARKACLSKLYESRQNKENWCHNQFGNH